MMLDQSRHLLAELDRVGSFLSCAETSELAFGKNWAPRCMRVASWTLGLEGNKPVAGSTNSLTFGSRTSMCTSVVVRVYERLAMIPLRKRPKQAMKRVLDEPHTIAVTALFDRIKGEANKGISRTDPSTVPLILEH
jgi:hypothetical protein